MAQFGQNWTCQSHCCPLQALEDRVHLVVKGLGAKSIIGQGVFVSLDGLDLGGLHPQVALLGADAAVAGADGFDLGQFHFIDECTTVAVAAVCLEGLVCVGHGCGVC